MHHCAAARESRDRTMKVLPAIVAFGSIIGLTAADGIAQSKAPEAAAFGVHVWNGDIMEVDTAEHLNQRKGQRLEPVKIVGTRNGTFSGKVVVGSPEPVKGLRATMDALKGRDAMIPASAVRVRYGAPWPSALSGWRRRPAGSDVLLDGPLAVFPTDRSGASVVPIWITVSVPKEIPADTYAGHLTIRSSGQDPITVPLEMKVADWTMPDTQQWRTWVELVQSPDTLAVEYGIDLWSEKHWRMIASSMRLIGEVGSRVVHVPLICHTNHGNEQSMVRWVRKGKNGYEQDFSVMERYLDIAVEHMGKPKIVALDAWDVYLHPSKKRPVGSYEKQMETRLALKGKGPAVTVRDPKTNTCQTVHLPRYEDPASRKLWQPVYAEIRRRMAARGLEKTLMLGLVWEYWPSKEEVQLLDEISGRLPWVSVSHTGRVLRNGGLQGIARIGYDLRVFGLTYDPDPADGRMQGWRRPELMAQYDRFSFYNSFPLTTLRHVAEFNITGGQRGVGRIGADCWPVLKDKRGRLSGYVVDRYPQSHWRNWNYQGFLLAPGPDGPVATARYENFREGIQECEARIFIEHALTDGALGKALGAGLVQQCEKMLDERIRCMWLGAGRGQGQPATTTSRGRIGASWRVDPGVAGHRWFVNSGWQRRSKRLYSLAGEVAKKLRAQ